MTSFHNLSFLFHSSIYFIRFYKLLLISILRFYLLRTLNDYFKYVECHDKWLIWCDKRYIDKISYKRISWVICLSILVLNWFYQNLFISCFFFYRFLLILQFLVSNFSFCWKTFFFMLICTIILHWRWISNDIDISLLLIKNIYYTLNFLKNASMNSIKCLFKTLI